MLTTWRLGSKGEHSKRAGQRSTWNFYDTTSKLTRITSAACSALGQGSPKGPPISRGRGTDIPVLRWVWGSRWKSKWEGSYCCGIFGKYNLSHHLFGFGTGKLGFSIVSLNFHSIINFWVICARLGWSPESTKINEKTLFHWGVHRWAEKMNNENAMWWVIQPRCIQAGKEMIDFAWTGSWFTYTRFLGGHGCCRTARLPFSELICIPLDEHLARTQPDHPSCTTWGPH